MRLKQQSCALQLRLSGCRGCTSYVPTHARLSPASVPTNLARWPYGLPLQDHHGLKWKQRGCVGDGADWLECTTAGTGIGGRRLVRGSGQSPARPIPMQMQARQLRTGRIRCCKGLARLHVERRAREERCQPVYPGLIGSSYSRTSTWGGRLGLPSTSNLGAATLAIRGKYADSRLRLPATTYTWNSADDLLPGPRTYPRPFSVT